MPITIGNEEYLTQKEAAAFVGVSAVTFHKLEQELSLKSYTRPGAGHRKFFKKTDLEPLLEMQPGQTEPIAKQ